MAEVILNSGCLAPQCMILPHNWAIPTESQETEMGYQTHNLWIYTLRLTLDSILGIHRTIL